MHFPFFILKQMWSFLQQLLILLILALISLNFKSIGKLTAADCMCILLKEKRLLIFPILKYLLELLFDS